MGGGSPSETLVHRSVVLERTIVHVQGLIKRAERLIVALSQWVLLRGGGRSGASTLLNRAETVLRGRHSVVGVWVGRCDFASWRDLRGSERTNAGHLRGLRPTVHTTFATTGVRAPTSLTLLLTEHILHFLRG